MKERDRTGRGRSARPIVTRTVLSLITNHSRTSPPTALKPSGSHRGAIGITFERSLYFPRNGRDLSTSGTFWSQSIKERMSMARVSARWKEDKGRLAFDDRFQYHEWTFKQACISPPPSSSPTSTTSLLPTLSFFLPLSVYLSLSLFLYLSLLWHPSRRPSTTAWLGCFPFRPRSVFSRAVPLLLRARGDRRAKLCAILNILISRATPRQRG